MKKERKSSVKIIIITTIICLILFVPIGIYIGPKIMDTISKKDIAQKENNNEQKEKEIDINSVTATKAMDSLEKIYISDESLYSSNSFNISQISNYDLLASAVRIISESTQIVSACSDEGYTEIPIDELNKNLPKYIKNKTLTKETIDQLFKGQQFVYVPTSISVKRNGNNLKLAGPCDLMGYLPDYSIQKTIKATETEENVYIYKKIIFAKYDFENRTDYIPPINYYRTYNNGTIIGTTTGENSWTADSDINWDLFDTYKYTFKKDNNNFYFEQIEIIMD